MHGPTNVKFNMLILNLSIESKILFIYLVPPDLVHNKASLIPLYKGHNVCFQNETALARIQTVHAWLANILNQNSVIPTAQRFSWCSCDTGSDPHRRSVLHLRLKICF